jgi:8-oxo-dGTP pyrophosphatase MutT (NUDIX family)
MSDFVFNDDLIIETGVPTDRTPVLRRTVRAIIRNDDGTVLMAYSPRFDDYTFPGGGIKESETPEDALRRELAEELGAQDVVIQGLLMTTRELKFSIRGDDTVFLQESGFYLCEVETFGEPSLKDRERRHGIEAVRIRPSDALSHNTSVMDDAVHDKPGLRTVLRRENKVLEALIKENEHAQI